MKTKVFVALMLLATIGVIAWNKGEPKFDPAATISGVTGPLRWNLDPDSTLSIRGAGAMPDYYYGNDAPWSAHLPKIKRVVIEKGVTSIGNGAFYTCTSLTTITIPEGVTRVGYEAFAECTSLTAIAIPEGVTWIGNEAFAYCASLAGIDVAPANPNYTSEAGVLFDKAKTTLVCYPAGKSGATYVVPDGVKRIGNWAFAFCRSLRSITLPEGVTSIGNAAFTFCASLTTMTIPAGVTDIASWTFSYCTQLRRITLPDGVTSVGAWAFRECESLEGVVCPTIAPPQLGTGNFGINGSDTLYVPAESVAAYQADPQWNDRFAAITAIP